MEFLRNGKSSLSSSLSLREATHFGAGTTARKKRQSRTNASTVYESSMVTKIGQTNRQQNLIENFLGNVTQATVDGQCETTIAQTVRPGSDHLWSGKMRTNYRGKKIQIQND
jgi:hypothetical protein